MNIINVFKAIPYYESSIFQFLNYNDLINLSLTNKLLNAIIDNENTYEKIYKNITKSSTIDNVMEKIMDIIKLPFKRWIKIIYLDKISSNFDMDIGDLEKRRDVILSVLYNDKRKIYFLVDYYLACGSFEIVEKLLLLCDELSKTDILLPLFYIYLLMCEYNKKHDTFNVVSKLNINLFVYKYVNYYLFSYFFINRITKNCLNTQTYLEMINHALLNKKIIMSQMTKIHILNYDDTDVLFNFFIGHCYSEINSDKCLEYFSKIDFEKTYFINNRYNNIIFTEFIKKKQFDFVIKSLKYLTKINDIFCYENYCNLIRVHVYNNLPYDKCVVLSNNFPDICISDEEHKTYRNFYYMKSKIIIELKFKNYKTVKNILHNECDSLDENMIMLKKYYLCILSYLQNNIIFIDNDLEEDYVMCSLLQKKYEKKNMCFNTNKKYEYILKRKKIYEKIINYTDRTGIISLEILHK